VAARRKPPGARGAKPPANPAPAAGDAPSPPGGDAEGLLARAAASGRVHSAYLLSGPGPGPREAALRFARALVCQGGPPRPCERCAACRRSTPGEEIPLDGAGKSGPLFRHVGDHPDLLFVERGAGDTRVRIAQIRALQARLRLRANEGARKAAILADAEWLNQEAQNALLRLLEEPPPGTTLILVAASAAGLLATVRSRCQRIPFRPSRPERLVGEDAPEPVREAAGRLARLGDANLAEVLDWAEEYRGGRTGAAAVAGLLETAAAWLRDRVVDRVRAGGRDLAGELDAFATVHACRQSLAQRNANPQMVAERALLAVRDALRASPTA
jgi:DNA polymerase-3 subunit delta'